MPAKSSKHWAKNDEWRRKNRAEQLKAGICKCKRPLMPGRMYCAVCLDENRERLAKMRAAKKLEMVCLDCSKPVRTGKVRCSVHRIKAARTCRLWRKFNKMITDGLEM